MSPQQTSSEQAPDKEYLYGQFQKGQDWKSNLQKLGTFKALDIADHEMGDIVNNINKHGSTFKEKLLYAAVIITALLIYTRQGTNLFNLPAPSPTSDSAYDVRFYDKDGNLIDVPRKGQTGSDE